MGELLNSSESSPAASGLWIGRIMIAIVFGEAIWAVLVSITNNLILPGLAKALGPDSQLSQPGKLDFNFAALLISVLELCLAGITCLLIYAWAQRSVRPRVIRTAAASAPRTMSILAPPANPPAPERPIQAAPAKPSAPPPPLARPIETDALSKPSTPTSPGERPIQATPPPKPPLPASPPPQMANPPDPTRPKKPKVVRYNLVGDPVDDE